MEGINDSSFPKTLMTLGIVPRITNLKKCEFK